MKRQLVFMSRLSFFMLFLNFFIKILQKTNKCVIIIMPNKLISGEKDIFFFENMLAFCYV